MIRSQHIEIEDPVKLGDVDIWASDSVHIGQYSVIKSLKVMCRSLWIGEHVYIGENVGIGGGGCMGPQAHVRIGDTSLIADGSFINCAAPVTIGKHVAFGYGTQIWTHSVWSPVEQGFPKQKQEPVTIGDEVWLPAGCQVLPGVTIGSNVVVGMGSLVNKNLPDGCLAVGRPARVIRENCYPKPLSDYELELELERICDAYERDFNPQVRVIGGCALFQHEGETVIFDARSKEFTNTVLTPYAEDFRDHLRRNGFPFYGGGFFESLVPERFRCSSQ
jgi:acetyltransferase-like isoleucine patch superfamily enzyme